MRLRRHRGFVFVVAMVGMATMFLIGTFFMRRAVDQFDQARRDYADVQALAAAESGLSYAYWRQNYAPQEMRLDVTDTLGDPHALEVGDDRSWQPAPLADSEAQSHVWLGRFPASSPKGYEVVSIGVYRQYKKAVRAVFTGGDDVIDPGGGGQTPGDEDDPTTETLYFSKTLHCGSDLDFAADCAIGGNVAVNGDLTMGNSGRFVRVGDAGGNVNVNGDLTMDGNARIEGVANVKGNVSLPGGSPKILHSVNSLGNISIANAGSECTNATCNGNLTIQGSTQQGVFRAGGDATLSGWGTPPTRIEYGGNLSTKRARPEYGQRAVKTPMTPLPSNTGDVEPIPLIDMTKYQPTNCTKQVAGNLTVNNGAPKITDTDLYVTKDVTFTGGPNIMNLPDVMTWRVDGNFTSTSNTTINCKDLVLFVNGNITLGGTFNFNSTGKVIIVAMGALRIEGGHNFGNSKVVLMSPTSIYIRRNRPINAWIYCHNSTHTALFTAASPDIKGAVICDRAVLEGSGNVFDYVAPTYPFIPPGDDGGGEGGDPGGGNVGGSSYWDMACWEELY